MELSRGTAQLSFVARLQGVPSDRFEHRIGIAPQLIVDRVELSQSDGPVDMRWSRQGESLVVTLLESPATDQTLTVTGHWQLDKPSDAIRLPTLAVEDATTESRACKSIAKPVRTCKFSPAATGTTSRNTLRAPINRTWGDWWPRWKPALKAGNNPRSSLGRTNPSGTQRFCSTVTQADGDWQSEALVKVRVIRGVLDELHLSVSEGWSGGLILEPVLPHDWGISHGEARRQISIRPAKPITDRLELVLRGPLQTSTTGIQAPDITVVGARRSERFVLLDKDAGGDPIDWQTKGLAPVGANPPGSPATWQTDRSQWYRVTGPQAEATAQLRHAAAASPNVVFRGVEIMLLPNRRLTGVASMIVHPAGRREAIFVMPPGCRLVQSLVDGVPAPARRCGVRAWTIAAPSDTVRYELRIVYDATLPMGREGTTTARFPAPRLGTDIDRCLWSIQDAAGGGEIYLAGLLSADHSVVRSL